MSWRAPLVALLLSLLSCKSEERDKALVQLRARSPGERARAVRELVSRAKGDAETWNALARAARDPAPSVRVAVASALGSAPAAERLVPQSEGGPPDADDVLGGMLSDPLDEVRRAAALALGQRCGPRGKGYLLSAFGRSGTAVRGVIVESLGKCQGSLAEILAYDERRRRAKAGRQLEAPSSAQRAQAIVELGRLGRPEDVAVVGPLLDDKDGVIAAAAARALGEAGALAYEPRLAQLLSDDATLVAEAAAGALASLGSAAIARAAPLLEKATARPDEAGEVAAEALASIALPPAGLCAAAAKALRPLAAVILTRAGQCPAAALLAELPAADFARAAPLLSAALAAPFAPAPGAAKALSALVRDAPPEVATLAARAAQQLKVTAAGPALIAVARREKAAMDAERAAPPGPPGAEDDAAATARAVANAGRQQPADRAKYKALMARLAARGKKIEARAGASAQLSDLMRGAEPARRRALLAAALRATVALSVPGAQELAKALADDVEPDVRSAARGEPEPAPLAEAGPNDCLPQLPGALARAAVPPPGCLALVAAEGALPSELSARATAAAQVALFSDDGAERAAACAVLRRQAPALAPQLLVQLASDPEARVRRSCGSSPAGNETAPPKER